jgi:hypothetical protein
MRFASFFMGGFECSAHRRKDGKRLDLQATTEHDRFAEADFAALRRIGILSFRDGLRWHAIEARRNVYEWGNAETLIEAARMTRSDVIWDLCHYGWPDWLDVWSEEFPSRFAAFASAAAEHIVERGLAPKFCLINEISFMAWAGGEVAHFYPGQRGRGAELKAQLCRAVIAAAQAIRSTTPDAMFISAEPLIHVLSHSVSKKVRAAATAYCASQYEALDMLLGMRNAEMSGDQALIDVVGLNFYPENQWYLNGPTIPFGHHDFRPLRLMLQDTYARYGKPLLISETGAENSCRASWLHYVCGEVDAAAAAGVPILGVCIYPVLEYPGWDNDRRCAVGLLSGASESGERSLDTEFAAELLAQQQTRLAHETPARKFGLARQ